MLEGKMSATPNDSINTSDGLMDLSLKNFWVIIHYPYSDPGSEFEILSKKDLVFDSWDVIERGAVVTIKYGNARVQGIVVTVSDDFNCLSTNFNSIVEEYLQEYKEIQFEEKCKKFYDKHGNRGNFREIIKVADKESQTESIDQIENIDYSALKQQYEELQCKYDELKSTVADAKKDLQAALVKLGVEKNEKLEKQKVILQPINENNSVISNKENSVKPMVQIGSGGTKIPRHIYNSIKWTSYSAATRKLLITLFPRSILATHSLTGKPSPAFISSNKQTKMRLNPTIISDVIEVITKKCLVSESLVRNAITTKCADENKMYKKRLEKRQDGEDNENNENCKRIKVE